MIGKKILIFIGLLMITLSSNVYALKVSPAKIEDISIKRGKKGEIILYLRGSYAKEKIKVYLSDISLDRKGRFQITRLENWKYSCLSWIKPDEEKILTLSKSRMQDVRYRIKVPWRTRPGEYYACIALEPLEYTEVSLGPKRALEIKSAIAVPIILTVPGRPPKLDGKAISSDVNVTKEKISIFATFENTGTVLEEVTGRARIINKEDRRIYDIVRLNAFGSSSADGAGKIFPEGLRDFFGEVTRPLPEGEYNVVVSFDYGRKHWRARTSTSFVVTEEVSIKQKELLILAAEPDLIKMAIPSGGRRIAGINITNMDFQDVEIEAKAMSGWFDVRPEKFHLGAGKTKSIRLVIGIPRGEDPRRSGKIVFKPNRGNELTVGVVITRDED